MPHFQADTHPWGALPHRAYLDGPRQPALPGSKFEPPMETIEGPVSMSVPCNCQGQVPPGNYILCYGNSCHQASDSSSDSSSVQQLYNMKWQICTNFAVPYAMRSASTLIAS